MISFAHAVCDACALPLQHLMPMLRRFMSVPVIASRVGKWTRNCNQPVIKQIPEAACKHQRSSEATFNKMSLSFCMKDRLILLIILSLFLTTWAALLTTGLAIWLIGRFI